MKDNYGLLCSRRAMSDVLRHGRHTARGHRRGQADRFLQIHESHIPLPIIQYPALSCFLPQNFLKKRRIDPHASLPGAGIPWRAHLEEPDP